LVEEVSDDAAVCETKRSAAFDHRRQRSTVPETETSSALQAWRSFGLSDYSDAEWE